MSTIENREAEIVTPLSKSNLRFGASSNFAVELRNLKLLPSSTQTLTFN